MRLFAREIPPADGVVDESSHTARSEMLEFHLIHIYAGDADFLVALDDDSVISLVVKIRGTVDVIHFHTRGDARRRVAVHLARMGDDYQQAIVLSGKFGELIQQVGEILRLRLPRLGVMVEAVERVEDEDAAATAHDELTGFGYHTLGSGIAFEGNMRNVLRQKLFGTCQKAFRHAAAVLEAVGGELLDQFAEMVGDRDILRTEKTNLPLMPQAETQHQFVHPFGLSRAGDAG